jgi:formylglycine-generating enzyme required for sulfatase activity
MAQNPDNLTPFTIVVRGGWGRGKTTLLRETQRQLDEAAGKTSNLRRVHTLWFNAWKYPNEETILAGLLGAMLDEFRTGNLLKQLQDFIHKRKGRLTRMLLRIAAPWLDVEELAKPDARFDYAETKRAFYDEFRPLFAELWYLRQKGIAGLGDTRHRDLEKLLRENERQQALAIFLDDLDRCPEDRVLAVMQAINLFLDLPGVCFYLGVDWERLSEVLEKKLDGRQDVFLEKMVQVSLELPEVSEAGAGEYLSSKLDTAALGALFDNEEDGNKRALTAALASRHPRHIKGMLDDLSLTLSLLRNTNRLGSSAKQLPEQAVLAWHLLREMHDVSTWAALRARRTNLDALIRKWEALAETDNDAKPSEDFSERFAELHGRGVLHSQLKALNALSPEQRDMLVHFGSAATEETPTATARAAREPRRETPDAERWVALPSGEFAMGSDDLERSRPAHLVTLSAFNMARYPVTNAEYLAYVQATGKAPPRHWKGGEIPEGLDDHPVVSVSWRDAEAYCAWLSEKLKHRDRERVRLPTEAEWEYAARGAEGRTYPWGEEPPAKDRANYGDSNAGTSPVGSFPKGATPEGLHDLAGNVWEWCADWYGPYSEFTGPNPKGPDKGETRVLRGGAFDDGAELLRAASRGNGLRDVGDLRVGFRVVWSAPGGQD